MEKLSVRECLRFGWQTFKSRPWIFVQVTLVIFVVSMALQFGTSLLQGYVEDAAVPVYVVVTLALAVLSAILGTLIEMGMNAFYLRAHDAPNEVRLANLRAPYPFVKYFFTKLLAGLLVFAGFLLLIIPGIILALLFSFVAFIVMDKHLGPVDALRESVRLTKRNLLKIFLLSLTIAVLNILGLIALVVGLVVTIPVSVLAFVHAYRVLSGPQVSVPVTEAPPVGEGFSS